MHKTAGMIDGGSRVTLGEVHMNMKGPLSGFERPKAWGRAMCVHLAFHNIMPCVRQFPTT